jgi:hypothetical protein
METAMKWIYGVNLIAFVVLLSLAWIFYYKLDAVNERLNQAAISEEILTRFDAIEKRQAMMRGDINKAFSGIWDRLDALETGTAEMQPRGAKTPDFLLAELERWIHLRKDAQWLPEEQSAAQKKIDGFIKELENMQLEGEDIIARLLEHVKVNRDPDVRLTLIRDVIWRFGPEAVPGLLDLFRDKEFAGNLRVVAALSALKAGGNENELLAEFTEHLEDPEEFSAVKTPLVRDVFSQYRHEGAVDILIEGARNPGFRVEHRVACLRALGKYDHPKVVRALEEILHNYEDDGWVINWTIDAYHNVLKEESVPFFKEIMEKLKPGDTNRAKMKNILKLYE